MSIVKRACWRTAGVVMLAAVVAFSCGSPAPTPGATGPRTGGTLSVAWQDDDLRSFDPAWINYEVEAFMAERLVFEPLYTYDTGTKVAPLLAESLPQVSADGLTYTVRLRDGVSFVDRQGAVLREVTAADVVHSFNRLFDPKLKSPHAGQFANIAGANDVIAGTASEANGIAVLDDRTVRFTLVHADQTFINLLALPIASIVPVERAGTDTAAFSADPVGTGPYLLKSYSPGQQAVFVRNPHYWKTRIGPDQIDFRVGVDSDVALQQIEAGSLDLMADQLPSGEFSRVVEDPSLRGRVFHERLVETEWVFFDTGGKNPDPSSPLTNVTVRQALEYAVDKEAVRKLTHGAGVVANCIFPPGLPGYDESCKPYVYDVATAKTLLAKAGYSSGFKTDFYTDNTDPDQYIALAIKQDLAKVGVQIDIYTMDIDALLTRIGNHAVPMGYLGWIQDWPDPSDFVDPILSCATLGNNNNHSWYCNKEVDAMAAAARGEQDQAKRMAAYRAIQRRIMEDAPLIPVRHAEHYTLVSARVRGFAIHPVWLYDLASVWLAG